MCTAFTVRRFYQYRQALPALAAIPGWRVLLLAVAGTTAALGQENMTDTANGILAALGVLGTLTPAKTSTPTSGQVQFRLRDRDATGYRLDAVATFTAGAAATVNGGDTIAGTDIGIGITSIVPSSVNVDSPRADVILPGFNYNPSTVSAIDGLTPYNNAAGGKATVADLLTSKKILSGNRIAQNSQPTNTDYLTVTMTFGVLPQYFSPSSFSAMITLTISAGP